MIPGPASWRWGGTWIGAYKGTKSPALAKEYIRYLTTDDGFLEQWARDKGDMVSNLAVVNKIKDNFSEPFLGGQNHYAEFAEMAKNVDGKLSQANDNPIEGYFNEVVVAVVNGEKTKAQALADFRAIVETQFGL
jgi:ABC-type glycerol-3-phosphate transport system substrate-binding protein